jgi:hypothetical protein
VDTEGNQQRYGNGDSDQAPANSENALCAESMSAINESSSALPDLA